MEYFRDYDNFTWKFPEKVKYLIIYSINMINNWRQIFMLLTRYTKLNGDLIRNLPFALKSELIIFEGVISDAIMFSLYANDSFYKKEKFEFLEYRGGLF